MPELSLLDQYREVCTASKALALLQNTMLDQLIEAGIPWQALARINSYGAAKAR